MYSQRQYQASTPSQQPSRFRGLALLLLLGSLGCPPPKPGPIEILTTSPAAFDIWVRGQTYSFSWKTNATGVSTVDVALLDDLRGAQYQLASAITNTGQFSYSVPADMKTSGPYRFRVSKTGEPATMGLSAPFFIEEWNWMENKKVDVYQNRPDTGVHRIVDLPYYSQEGPVTSDISASSMHPKFGWTLLYKDFGTPAGPVIFPRLIFYNKYSGLLRIFYYYGHLESSWSNSVVILRKPPVQAHLPALFTFDDEDSHEYLDSYSEARELRYIGVLTLLQWNYADFVLAGYDPNPQTDSKLEVAINGLLLSNVAINGTIDLNQVNVGTSGSTGSGSSFSLSQGYAMFKSVSDFQDLVDKNTKPGGKWETSWFGGQKLRDAVLNNPVASVAPYLAPFVGWLAGALFGDQSSPAPLQLHGEINLSGTITDQRELSAFSFNVPGAPHSSTANLPLYDEPIGIFNLVSMPVIKYSKHEHVRVCHLGGFLQSAVTVFDSFDHRPSIRDDIVLVNPLLRSRVSYWVAAVADSQLPDFYQNSSVNGYNTVASTNTHTIHQDVPTGYPTPGGDFEECDCPVSVDPATAPYDFQLPPGATRKRPCLEKRRLGVELFVQIPYVQPESFFLKAYRTDYQEATF